MQVPAGTPPELWCQLPSAALNVALQSYSDAQLLDGNEAGALHALCRAAAAHSKDVARMQQLQKQQLQKERRQQQAEQQQLRQEVAELRAGMQAMSAQLAAVQQLLARQQLM